MEYILDVVGIVESVFLMFFCKYCFFLEVNTPEQQKKMKKILLVDFIVMVLMTLCEIWSDYLTNHLTKENYKLAAYTLDVTVVLLVIGIVGLYVAFVYSSWTARKTYKWLSLFMIIPLYGYVNAIGELFFYPIKLAYVKDVLHIGNMQIDTYRFIPYTVICLILLCIIVKKPKWYVQLQQDIETREASKVDMISLWAVGVCLHTFSIILDEKYADTSNGLEGIFIVGMAVIAVTVLLLIRKKK